jgi:hypothetical protein
LGLSTILDMVVTWFYTRPLVILLGRSDRLSRPGRFSIARGLGSDGQGTETGSNDPGPGGPGSTNGKAPAPAPRPKPGGLIRPSGVPAS